MTGGRLICISALMSLALAACQGAGGGPYAGRAEFDTLNRRVECLERRVGEADFKRPASSSARGKSEAVSESGGQGARNDLPVSSAGASAPSTGRAHEISVYQKGQDLFKQKKYGRAAQSFQSLIRRHPSGALAPNARYWLGECHYAQGNYRQAAREFQRYAADYPALDKAPDALLKLSYSYDSLNNGPQAMKALGQLLKLYPNSRAALMMKSGQGGFGKRLSP